MLPPVVIVAILILTLELKVPPEGENVGATAVAGAANNDCENIRVIAIAKKFGFMVSPFFLKSIDRKREGFIKGLIFNFSSRIKIETIYFCLRLF